MFRVKCRWDFYLDQIENPEKENPTRKTEEIDLESHNKNSKETVKQCKKNSDLAMAKKAWEMGKK